ncbi:hypothetical protein EVAR_69953_1 [Eumeta japonica]|uniref:Uncharacterized protein n=1 Tax=Eumeta variegata TaxID=151549 RepID=A0A4C1SPJ6_EUMVA|nr:hypothetical protein EVAR_69953_1 [Eumeta japonica]
MAGKKLTGHCIMRESRASPTCEKSVGFWRQAGLAGAGPGNYTDVYPSSDPIRPLSAQVDNFDSAPNKLF